MSSVAVASLDEILAEAGRVESEKLRRIHAVDPEAWLEHRLKEQLWSAQREIMRSVKQNRKTAVMSCHEIGKSFIASRIVSWWIDSNPPGTAGFVTTAPTNRQVRTILWKEIRRAHAKGLIGRCNETEWKIPMGGDNDETVGIGFKPSDYDPTAFQGMHATRFLVIGDEACGIPQSLLDAMESLIANDFGRLLLLGNPDDPRSAFFNECKPGSGYNVISVGAFDTPAFTGEKFPSELMPNLVGRVYVEDKRRKWAPQWRWVDARGKECDFRDGARCVPPEGADEYDTHPFWQSKVLGRFPRSAEEGALIPMAWVRRAQEQELEAVGANELGVDVGGGGDSSTVAHRVGPVVRIVHEDRNPDTMQTCGKVVALRKKLKAKSVKVDKIGIGAGIVNRAQELEEPVIGINVGEASPTRSDEFVNLKAELWWNIRELFESGGIDIDLQDEDTAGELCSIRYFRTSSGKIQIESKDQAKKRGIPSPNRADAIMLAFADPVDATENKPKGALLW